MNHKRFGRVVRLFLGLVCIALLAVAYVKRYELYDAWQLRDYQASPAIASLVENTKMNDYGRRLFYVNHPDIENKASFASNCGTQEKTIVLGCYISGRGIYLLTVTDARLDGVQQVTAAHEMLHAAYDRLSLSDKKKVNSWLEAAYKTVTDQRIKDTIQQYRQNNADIDNELHSILGTEVGSLGPNLEQYYQRYFTDRTAVVTYSNKYESVFTDRKKQIEAYDQQLTQLEQQFKAATVNLDSQQAALAAERSRLNALLAVGDRAGYNAGVAPYNTKVRNYNAAVVSANDIVSEYKAVLAKRNAVAQETQDLVKALDDSISDRSTIP
jgi:hypothetical protein